MLLVRSCDPDPNAFQIVVMEKMKGKDVCLSPFSTTFGFELGVIQSLQETPLFETLGLGALSSLNCSQAIPFDVFVS